MAMGHKEPTASLAEALPQGQGQPFYQKLEELLVRHDFDRFVEERCRTRRRRTAGSCDSS